jgi:hypothetical protein
LNDNAIICKIESMFYYAYTYNKIFKLNRQSGKLEKSYILTGLRPYFIANNNFIYGIINDAKRILILNLNLEQMTEISYMTPMTKYFLTQMEQI